MRQATQELSRPSNVLAHPRAESTFGLGTDTSGNRGVVSQEVWFEAWSAQNAVLSAIGTITSRVLSTTGDHETDNAWALFDLCQRASDALSSAITTLGQLRQETMGPLEEPPANEPENPTGQGLLYDVLPDAARSARRLEWTLLALLRRETSRMHETGRSPAQELAKALHQVHIASVLLREASGH